MSFHVEDRHISYRINEDVLSILPADAVHPGTDSSSTVSDLPGPGRTLDKFIGIAGAAIERMCDSIGTRMGLGPHAAMARLVEALLRSRIYSCESEGHNQHCNFDWCNSYFHRDVLRRLQEHPGDLLTLLDATLALTIYYYSSTLQNVLRTVEKECNRIIKYIRHASPYSRNEQLVYVTALSALLQVLQYGMSGDGSTYRLQNILAELCSHDPLTRSRSALVHTAQADVMGLIKEYAQMEGSIGLGTLGQSVNGFSYLGCVEMQPMLLGQMSVLLEKSLIGKTDVSHLAVTPILRTLGTGIRIWHNTLPPPRLMEAFTFPRVMHWLQVVVFSSDPFHKTIGVRLLKELFEAVVPGYTAFNTCPLIFEKLWLPLSASYGVNLICRNREQYPDGHSLRLQLRPIQLPWMISLEIEEQLLPDTVSRLRLLEATSPPIFEELNATSFKLLGRFMHEWNARRSSALNGGMRDFESYVLAFPTAVGLARLGKLASRLVEFHLRSSKVPDVVAIVTQKDRDVCDAMLDVLRGRLACTHKDDQRSREGILNRLDLLSFIFDLRSIVTLPLHDSSWVSMCDVSVWRFPDRSQITGDARHSEQYGLMLDWNCMFEGADRLIGDVSSLRWVPIKDMPVRLEDYSPIVAYLDDAGRQRYITSVLYEGDSQFLDSRSSPAPVSVSDDFEVLESHVYDWSYTSRDTRKTAMYVLAARRLPKGAATAPHVYWAPPEWQHTLCSWVRCNMKAPFWTDDGKRTEYNSSSAWCIHIPDAIPDVTLINAVSLEETLIRGGNQCEVDVATWFEGGPTLRWNGSSWNPCKLGRPSYLDSNDSHGKAAIMHLRYPKEVLEAALDQLDDVDDDGHTFVLDGVLDEEGERRLEVEARRSLVEQERILDVFIKW